MGAPRPSTGKVSDTQRRTHAPPACLPVVELGTALTKKNLSKKAKGTDLSNLQPNRNMWSNTVHYATLRVVFPWDTTSTETSEFSDPVATHSRSFNKCSRRISDLSGDIQPVMGPDTEHVACLKGNQIPTKEKGSNWAGRDTGKSEHASTTHSMLWLSICPPISVSGSPCRYTTRWEIHPHSRGSGG